MASYTKRGNTWQYNISYIEDGRQKSMRKGGFKTKKEAMEAALQVELDLVNGVLNPRIIRLRKYFKSWYETFKTDTSNITLNSYKASHSKLVTYGFRHTHV